MRAILLILALFVTSLALAQSGARPRPPGTTALVEPPPLATSDTSPAPPPTPRTAQEKAEAALEQQQQVTVRKEGESTIEEYRVRGKIFMVRVTPKHGRPYVLIDHKGDGTLARQGDLDPGVRVPQWVIAEF